MSFIPGAGASSLNLETLPWDKPFLPICIPVLKPSFCSGLPALFLVRAWTHALADSEPMWMVSIQPEYLPCTECPGLAQVQGGCSPPISCHPPPSQPGWPHFLLLLSAAEMQTVWRGVSLPGRFQSLQVCALPLWGALSNHTKRWLRPCLLGTVSRAHSVAAS